MPISLPRILTALSLLAAPALAQQSKPLDPANLDTECPACDDFYHFANGGWAKRTPIPAAYASWGSFNELYDRNQTALRAVLADAATDPSVQATSPIRQVGTFYATCMDTAAIEHARARPIARPLAQIRAMSTQAHLQAEIARLHAATVPVLFALNSTQDPKNTTRVIADVSQGGLGLPDRDYYTRADSASARIRAAYVAHVERTLVLLGFTPQRAKRDAATVMRIETRLAAAQMTLVEQRDPNNITHITTVADLQTSTPTFQWRRYLSGTSVPAIADLNVQQPAYFRTVDSMLTQVPIADWKPYLRWHVANDASRFLDERFVNENFRFQQVLTGAKELRPRWKRCIDFADGSLGEALGQAYVAKHFTPDAKRRALEMVRNIEGVMKERIGTLAWMGDSTRAQAHAKLATFVDKIGYPDRWRDYSSVRITPEGFFGNIERASEFEFRRQIAKVGQPVDRMEWGMSPPTVNAYYNPLMNEIVFPAGIMQPPFFDPTADDAVNYGGMGAVIGHEISHGFDDQGRQFDAQGNLRDWWTKDDAAAFTKRATLVVNEFNAFTVVDTATHVNGQLTLGENLADLAGLTIAYHAFEKSLEGKPRPANIDGFTPEQRFFLAWAQVWRTNARPEAERTQVVTDPHAPARWRVNGPVANMPEFAKAWSCKAGDRMVRADDIRAQIW